MNEGEVERLRSELDEIDRQLVSLAARRQAVVSGIGKAKQSAGRGTRDFRREKAVMEHARQVAREQGLEPGTAESLMQVLIQASLTHQEQDRLAASSRGGGKTALVIGGTGRMGRWFADFLAGQGYGITIADPAGPVEGHAWLSDWTLSPLDESLIVVATPLRIADRILHALAERSPSGLVVEIGSLKAPLKRGLAALAAAGVAAASLHPMFGPDTRLLSGRHVIVVDAGDGAAAAAAGDLFADTMAEVVTMDLDEHDRLIAWILGLSHALNIGFFSALTASAEQAPRLARMGSTTFDRQLDVAARVAAENPDLYWEIQALNPFGGEVLKALEEAVSRLRAHVQAGDAAGFTAMMTRGRDYLAGLADAAAGRQR
jgi:chorismate mutase/prephenate dehydrogenase